MISKSATSLWAFKTIKLFSPSQHFLSQYVQGFLPTLTPSNCQISSAHQEYLGAFLLHLIDLFEGVGDENKVPPIHLLFATKRGNHGRVLLD